MSKLKEIYIDLMDGTIHKTVLQWFVSCNAKIRFLMLRHQEPLEVTVNPDEWAEFLKNKGSFFHEFTNYFGIVTNEEDFTTMLRQMHKRKVLYPGDEMIVKEALRDYCVPIEEMKDESSPFVIYYGLIDAFLEFEAKRLCQYKKINFDRLMLLWKPVAVELEFDSKKIVTLPKKLVDTYGYADMLFEAKGTIDRINRFDLEQNHLEIMEYKTGGWNTQSSHKLTNVRRELAFYKLFKWTVK